MTYEKFAEKCLDGPLRNFMVEGHSFCRFDDDDELEIVKRWVIGGSEGGSIWNGSKTYQRNSEEEPEWESLDSLIDSFAPDMKYREYKDMMKSVTNSEFTETEYYNNSYLYAVRTLSLRIIYKFFINIEAIQGD